MYIVLLRVTVIVNEAISALTCVSNSRRIPSSFQSEKFR